MHIQRIAVAFALTLGLAACDNAFTVGETKFYIERNAEPWPDLPEAVDAMQQLPDTPRDMWDANVFLFPPWYPVGSPGTACLYDHTIHRIAVRVSGETVADSCLPHEFAHRWHFLEDGYWTATNDAHNERYDELHSRLRDAAGTTWAHRN